MLGVSTLIEMGLDHNEGVDNANALQAWQTALKVNGKFSGTNREPSDERGERQRLNMKETISRGSWCIKRLWM
jgi:hypothetical protein